MITTSTAYKTKIKSPSRELRIRLIFSSLSLTLDENHILSAEYNEGIVGGEEFQIGGAIASTFDIKINNQDKAFSGTAFDNKEAELFFGVVLDDESVEYVSMGAFVIEYASKPLDIITLQGIDYMYKFEKPYESTLTYPRTLSQIASDICSKAGVTLKSTTFNNSTFSVAQKPDLTGATLRQTIGWIAEACGGFARVTRDKKLEITWLNNTVEVIDGHLYYDLTVQDEQQLIDKLIIQYSDLGLSIGTGNNPYTIKDNPFLMLDTSANYDAIFNQIRTINYRPMIMPWNGNPAHQAGDIIQVKDRDDVAFNTVITNMKITFHGGLRSEVKAAGKNTTAKAFASKGTVLEQIKGAKAQIKLLNDTIILKASKEEVEELGQTLSEVEQKITPTAIVSTVRESSDYVNDLANKNRVFTSSPTVPYSVGDIWINGTILRRCSTAKASGGTYALADWTQVNNRIFTSQPTPPYIVGDLWMQGDTTSSEVMRCNTARASGSYTASDWVKATGYGSRLSTAETSISQMAGKIESKVTQTEIDNSINALQIGGRNLARFNQWSTWMGSVTREGNEITLVAADTGSNGISHSATNLQLLSSTQYVLSFKIRQVAGTLSRIGGHTDTAFSTRNFFKIDNVEYNNSFGSPPTVPTLSDGNWHTVEYCFTTPATIVGSNLIYIQANRNSYTHPLTVIIKDLQVEKGNKGTDWTPAPEDIDSRITTAETLITQLPDKIQLEVSKSKGGGNIYPSNLPSWEQGTIASVSGAKGTATNRIRLVEYLDVPPGSRYTVTWSDAIDFGFYYYRMDGSYVSANVWITSGNYTLNIPADAHRLALVIRYKSEAAILPSAGYSFNVQILPVTHKVSTMTATFDDDGLVIDKGAYRLKDAGGVEYTITPDQNLVNDHSFELLTPTGNIDITHNDFVIDCPTITQGNWFQWRKAGTPRLLTDYNTSFPLGRALFGFNAVATSLNNYIDQRIAVPDGGGQFTISTHAYPHPTRCGGGATVRSRIFWAYLDANGTQFNSGSDTLTLTTSHSSASARANMKRHSLTLNVPSNCAVIRIVVYSPTDTEWVVHDGVQFVRGPRPVFYMPEDSLWAMARNYGGIELLTPHIKNYLTFGGVANAMLAANGTNGALRHSNNFGHVDIGPMNALHAHIYTDRPSFYFNKDLIVNGNTVSVAGHSHSNVQATTILDNGTTDFCNFKRGYTNLGSMTHGTGSIAVNIAIPWSSSTRRFFVGHFATVQNNNAYGLFSCHGNWTATGVTVYITNYATGGVTKTAYFEWFAFWG